MNFKKWFEAETYDNREGQNFWGNVGAGVLPIAKSTGRILISLRSPHVNEPNTWGIWGGKVDDEAVMDLEAEAKREFAEETGYTGSTQLIPAYVFKTKGFEYHNFIGIVPDEFEPNVPREHQWETAGHQWVTFEELLELEPKHFGLQGLLKNSGNIVMKHAN